MALLFDGSDPLFRTPGMVHCVILSGRLSPDLFGIIALYTYYPYPWRDPKRITNRETKRYVIHERDFASADDFMDTYYRYKKLAIEPQQGGPQ